MGSRNVKLVVAILNAIGAICIPACVMLRVAVADTVAVSRYRELQLQHIITVDQKVLANYSGSWRKWSPDPEQWSDVPEYLVEGFDSGIGANWWTGAFNGLTAIVLAIWL